MAASNSHSPRTVEEIFKDFSARHSAVLRALTNDVEDFYSQCDPERDNLCLYGHPNDSWEVAVPAEEVPPELPEPVLGINFARDGMERRDWLSLVAMHTDSWLLSVAFYFGARLNRNERSRMFTLINDLPTVFEVVTGRKPLKDKPSVDSGKKTKNNAKFGYVLTCREKNKLKQIKGYMRRVMMRMKGRKKSTKKLYVEVVEQMATKTSSGLAVIYVKGGIMASA
ncbi:PHD finger protein ALFIN-LIKE 2-like isoform X2 [Lycium ferocissimum]|uniref:PHD finger protein ALFIN-LIKE 2-like isoform X2 n=1 Tax=Lycium ferocissimum TaxID=112874 RepID=UPI0028166FFC|nr:PHD finger protein ALFIN-LIKE 2-like isoform X2 [Lycium ferocissimum]